MAADTPGAPHRVSIPCPHCGGLIRLPPGYDRPVVKGTCPRCGKSIRLALESIGGAQSNSAAEDVRALVEEVRHVGEAVARLEALVGQTVAAMADVPARVRAELEAWWDGALREFESRLPIRRTTLPLVQEDSRGGSPPQEVPASEALPPAQHRIGDEPAPSETESCRDSRAELPPGPTVQAAPRAILLQSERLAGVRPPQPPVGPIPVTISGKPPLSLASEIGDLIDEAGARRKLAQIYALYWLLDQFREITGRSTEDGINAVRLEGFPPLATELRQRGVLTPARKELRSESALLPLLLKGLSRVEREPLEKRVLPGLKRAIAKERKRLREWLDAPPGKERRLLVSTHPLPMECGIVPPKSRPVVAFDLGTVQSKLAIEWPGGDQRYSREPFSSLVAADLESGSLRFAIHADEVPEAHRSNTALLRGLKTCLGCEGIDGGGRCRNPWGGRGDRDDPQRYCGRTDHVWRIGSRVYETDEILGRLIESQLPLEQLPDEFDLHLSVPVFFDAEYRGRLLEAVDQVDFRDRKVQGRLLYHEPTGAAFWFARTRDKPLDRPFVVMDVGGGTTDIAAYLPQREALRCLAWGGARVGAADLDRVVLDLIGAATADVSRSDREHPDVRRTVERELAPERVRKAFLEVEQLSREIDLPNGGVVRVVLSRSAYRRACEPIVAEIRQTLSDVVARADSYLRGLGVDPLRQILLVGGGTLERGIRSLPEECGLASAYGMGEDVFLPIARGGTAGRENFREHVIERMPYEVGITGRGGEPVALLEEESPLERARTVTLTTDLVDDGEAHLALWARRTGHAQRQLHRKLSLAGTRFPLALTVTPYADRLEIDYATGTTTRRESILADWTHPLELLESSREFREETPVDVDSLLVDHQLAGEDASASAIQRHIAERMRPGDAIEMLRHGRESLLVHAREFYVGKLKSGRDMAAGRVSAIRRIVVEPRDREKGSKFPVGETVLAFDMERDSHG